MVIGKQVLIAELVIVCLCCAVLQIDLRQEHRYILFQVYVRWALCNVLCVCVCSCLRLAVIWYGKPPKTTWLFGHRGLYHSWSSERFWLFVFATFIRFDGWIWRKGWSYGVVYVRFKNWRFRGVHTKVRLQWHVITVEWKCRKGYASNIKRRKIVTVCFQLGPRKGVILSALNARLVCC